MKTRIRSWACTMFVSMEGRRHSVGFGAATAAGAGALAFFPNSFMGATVVFAMKDSRPQRYRTVPYRTVLTVR